MKLISSIALSVLVLSGIVGSASAQRFEGLIVYRIESGAGIIQQKSWVRGDSVVIESQEPMPERSFANFASRELTIYQGTQSQVLPLRDFDVDRPKTSHLKVQPERKTIDGKIAQLYTITIPTQDRKMMTTSFWLTADYPESVRNTIVRNMLIGNEDPMFREIVAEILDMGKVPVLLSVTINDKESMSLQVVTATEQSIPDAKFAQ
jgi:hypothetical protein